MGEKEYHAPSFQSTIRVNSKHRASHHPGFCKFFLTYTRFFWGMRHSRVSTLRECLEKYDNRRLVDDNITSNIE
jgi:hypothetical protein